MKATTTYGKTVTVISTADRIAMVSDRGMIRHIHCTKLFIDGKAIA